MELAASDCTVRFALLQFAPSVDLQYVLCYTLLAFKTRSSLADAKPTAPAQHALRSLSRLSPPPGISSHGSPR